MKDAPAFDFYPERWLVGVAAYSDAEQLAYLRLLCHQWLLGGLPDNIAALKRLAGKGVTLALMEKFPVCGDGIRRNSRLEIIRGEQRARIAKKSEQRKEAARRRWHPEQCDRNATASVPHMQTPCGDHAGAMPTTHHPPPTTHPCTLSGALSELGTGTGAIQPGAASPPDFGEVALAEAGAAMRIVRAYPANGNRYEAQAAVLRAIASGEQPDVMLAKVLAHAACFAALKPRDRQFCPGLATYFAESRWHDDPAGSPWTRHAPLTREQEAKQAEKRVAGPGFARSPALRKVAESERLSAADFAVAKSQLSLPP